MTNDPQRINGKSHMNSFRIVATFGSHRWISIAFRIVALSNSNLLAHQQFLVCAFVSFFGTDQTAMIKIDQGVVH